MDPWKWLEEVHFTHPPSPHTTSPAFPHQAERQAYEEMKENQLHNVRFHHFMMFNALDKSGGKS